MSPEYEDKAVSINWSMYENVYFCLCGFTVTHSCETRSMYLLRGHFKLIE